MDWLLTATNDGKCFVAKTTANPTLIYRAVCKWIVRGGASKILASFWEYIDQDDSELEDALLDQLETQAETMPADPQTTNVRTKDYSIDITVHAKNNTEKMKSCTIECTLRVYFQSVKKAVEIDRKYITLTMIKVAGDFETVNVIGSSKTPAEPSRAPGKRVNKRSSKLAEE